MPIPAAGMCHDILGDAVSYLANTIKPMHGSSLVGRAREV